MISKDTAEHYIWGEVCDGWHLVKNPALSVIHERMPAHTSEVRHYHRAARQFFFVLRGVALFELDGTQHELHAHQGIAVAPNVPHQMLNNSDADLEFLVVSQPPSHGDRVTIN